MTDTPPAADSLAVGAAAVGPPADPPTVRDRIVDALRLDLVGPTAGHPLALERLPGWVRPSNWYLTGFLVPSGMPPELCADADEDDDFDTEVPEDAGLAEESGEDRRAAKRGYFPSSMGISFLAPAHAERLLVTVRWGDYAQAEFEDASGKTERVWARTPRDGEITVPLPAGFVDADASSAPDVPVYDVPGSEGLQVHVIVRSLRAAGIASRIPPDARAVSLFLVNRRALPPEGDETDQTLAFQAEIEVRSDRSFLARPDLRGGRAGGADDWDERVADLHYAGVPEYATGHGVSADWEMVDGACRLVRTAWIPAAEVEKTETVDPPRVELSMETLGALADGAAVEAALRPLAASYRDWIESQRRAIGTLDGPRRATAEELLGSADVAAGRIERGIAALAGDDAVLDAFRVANRAVARALRQRLGAEAPRWRAFQLAFILLNLPGIADPRGSDREVVDLLFFPTGGGKTEAYLGLAAFTMVLRRLHHPGDGGLAGAGVSVIMRYTLRLLTLDQLGRAAGLVCALELERESNPGRYGPWPFEIGLWVGKAATPNLLGRKGDGRSDSARSKVTRFQADPRNRPSPVPLENCPWCSARFEPASFVLDPDRDHPRTLRLVCARFECPFSGQRPLPVVAVDEPLYRRLPAFLVATVDKFASLPWVGPSGVLLGGADRHGADGFYGPAEPGPGTRLANPLPPPELIIQDELHLIAGPLGTMVGLYETVIESLVTRGVDGRTVRPKDRRLDRHGSPRAGPDTGALRPRVHPGVPPAGARSAGRVLRPHGSGRRDAGAAVSRHCGVRPEPEGADAPAAGAADGGGRTRVPGRGRTSQPR